MTTNSIIGPVYISKVDLADEYMRLWVRMEDVPSVAFIIQKKNPSDLQLVEFHISLPMGYVDSAPYFYMATEVLTDLANKATPQRDVASEHPLERAAEDRSADDTGTLEDQAGAIWEQLLAEQRSATTKNVNVYLDDLIYIFQGGPKERRQILRNLFSQINKVFHPNETAYTDKKKPTPLNKIGQGVGTGPPRRQY